MSRILLLTYRRLKLSEQETIHWYTNQLSNKKIGGTSQLHPANHVALVYMSVMIRQSSTLELSNIHFRIQKVVADHLLLAR